MMDEPEYNADLIVISPETEAGGELYQQALAYAKEGKFDQAIASAEAITQHKFKLNQHFRDEALADIALYCVQDDNIPRALAIVDMINLTQYRDGPFRAIAVGYMKLGDIEAATAMIDKIQGPYIKEAALLKMRSENKS